MSQNITNASGSFKRKWRKEKEEKDLASLKKNKKVEDFFKPAKSLCDPMRGGDFSVDCASINSLKSDNALEIRCSLLSNETKVNNDNSNDFPVNTIENYNGEVPSIEEVEDFFKPAKSLCDTPKGDSSVDCGSDNLLNSNNDLELQCSLFSNATRVNNDSPNDFPENIIGEFNNRKAPSTDSNESGVSLEGDFNFSHKNNSIALFDYYIDYYNSEFTLIFRSGKMEEY